MEMTMTKRVYDINSQERCPIVIQNQIVGTYSYALYSKWYLQRMDNGERAIPNVNKFLNGLILRKFNIDVRDENAIMLLKNKLNDKNIGIWFEEYMESEYAKNRHAEIAR